MDEKSSIITNEVLPDRSTVNGPSDQSLSRSQNNQEDGEEVVRSTGLTVATATVFIIGEIAGSGVLALPGAITNAGWIGPLILVVCCFVSGYNGVQLGKCWIILQERWPEYRGHVRYPYPSIGERAVGKYMRYVVSVAVDITLFGVSTVFMLLAAQNIQSLFIMAGIRVSLCYWLIVLAGILIPISWLGTPKDFWPIAVGAAIATGVACILTTINIGIDSQNYPPPTLPPSNGFQPFFLAFGAILFAFGGASVFPTVQNDMRRPKDFSKVVIYGYAAILSMYVPVSLAGYLVYGDKVNDNGNANILQVLPPGGIRIAVEILITAHLLMAFVIAINPFSQELESVFKVPHKFCISRCILRTLLVLCVLFTAESVPHFGAVLDLIGGSTVTFLTFVAPSLFYLRLTSMKDDRGLWPDRSLPLHIKVVNVEIIIIGILGGVASTYSAIHTIVNPNTFIPPCYVNLTAASGFT